MRSLPTLVMVAMAMASSDSAALAHDHISVDTVGGRIVVRAGYYGNESGFAIDPSGRLMADGRLAVFPVLDVLTSGPLEGWKAGFDILLTSDFFATTGRLNGGHFRYELASVTPLNGGPGTLAWGEFDANWDFQPSASSDGATRMTRSFDVGFGGHNHDQGYAFSADGLYDVSLVAWDSNGVYADAAPVTIRFQVGQASACVFADLDCSGAVDMGDVALILLDFGPCAGCDADLDGNGSADFGDVALALLSFG
jgi:hypothetical protein